MTRRAAVLGQPQQSLELKLNVFDCELVLVENPTLSDSAAVILKVRRARVVTAGRLVVEQLCLLSSVDERPVIYIYLHITALSLDSGRRAS